MPPDTHDSWSLTSSSHVPVHLDLLADEPADLDVSPTDLAELQALVVQASKVFGPPPFRHYDALVSLSDQLSPGGGRLEHLDEGENNRPLITSPHTRSS